MNSDDILLNKRKTEDVWQRVRRNTEREDGGADRESTGLCGLLCGFMDMESASCECYRTHAAASGQIGRMFASMAADVNRHLRKLEAVYFMRTGKSYVPEKRPQEKLAVPQVIRTRYAEELISAGNYKRAAAGESDIYLAKLYKSMAEDAERHAGMLCEMAERLINQRRMNRAKPGRT